MEINTNKEDTPITTRRKKKEVIELPPFFQKIQSVDKATLARWMEFDDIFSYSTDKEEFLNQIIEKTLECQKCVLSENRTTVVKPDGKIGAKVMIIGEGPGFLEDLTGIPLVGPQELRGSRCNGCFNVKQCYSSKLLQSPSSFGKKSEEIKCNPRFNNRINLAPNKPFYLRSAGSIIDGIIYKTFGLSAPRQNWIDQYNKQQELLKSKELDTNSKLVSTDEFIPMVDSPWFITNTVLCRSYDPIRLKDEPPTGVPMQKCRQWLLSQWVAVEPKIIVCLGKKALEAVVGSEAGTKNILHGEITQTKLGPVIAQIHPAALMRENVAQSKAYGYARIGKALKDALDYANLNV